MTKENAQALVGLLLPAVLFVIFLILKLTSVIGWSWWWVTSPIWIVALLIILINIAYWMAFEARRRRRK